jgi:hypothetical protein
MAALQALAAEMQASDSDQVAAHDAVAKEQSLAEQVGPMLLSIKRMLLSQLGESNAVLSDFDITVAKPKRPTVEVKALAVAKRATTHKERGTEGTKERLESTATATVTVATATPPATRA